MPDTVQLAHYDNSWFHPGGSLLKRAAWFFVGQPILRSAWMPSSAVRIHLLRAFGARIGQGVTIKPSVDVKYPWHLAVGDHCWIGEHAWIDNLTSVRIESNVCVSQGAYLCTGNHDWSDPHFGLMIAPIHLCEGSWAGAKCMLMPGTVLGRGAIAAAGAVVSGAVPASAVYAGNPARFVKQRVMREGESHQGQNKKNTKGSPMKLLFINQFFWPDSSATSQQLTDLAAGLAARGIEVSVLCGDGGYGGAAGSQPPANVHVVRVKTLAFTKGPVRRVLSYLSFYVAAAVRILLMPRQDTIVSFTTPPVISLLGTMVKALRGSRHFVYEHDLYPDVAIDLGHFKRGGLIDRFVGALADFSRRHADAVIALGDCMKARLVARGIPASHVLIAEDWANSEAIQPMPRPGDPHELVLLYSGNLGLAHDLDTLTGAMKMLNEDKRFRFLFVGNASKRADLTGFIAANAIQSAEFRGYVPRDRLSEGLSLGDLGVVTQHNVCSGVVVPSKVYGILAAGRAVLFIGPRTAMPALIVERFRCGWRIEPGDVYGLTELLLHLAANRHLVEEAGVRARQALLDHYDLPLSIERIAGLLDAPLTSMLDVSSHTVAAPSQVA